MHFFDGERLVFGARVIAHNGKAIKVNYIFTVNINPANHEAKERSPVVDAPPVSVTLEPPPCGDVRPPYNSEQPCRPTTFFGLRVALADRSAVELGACTLVP